MVGQLPFSAQFSSFDIRTHSAYLLYAACVDVTKYGGPKRATGVPVSHHGLELVEIAPDGYARRVTTDRHFDSYPVWSPDGDWIAFLSSRHAPRFKDAARPPNLRLEVIGTFGSSRRLVNTGYDPGVYRRVAHVPPRWSPDGQRLAFVVAEGDVSREGDGSYAIVVTGVFDEERQRLTRTVSAPAWSPDGTRVAFARASQEGIGLYTIRPDGTDVRILTRIERWAASRTDGHLARIWVRNVAWSPDGEHLLYTWDDRVHVVNVDGSTRSWRLPGQGAEPAAAWSPDGSRIAVALSYEVSYDKPSRASNASTGRVVLYTTAADGSDRRDLVLKTPGGHLVAAGTSDGAG